MFENTLKNVFIIMSVLILTQSFIFRLLRAVGINFPIGHHIASLASTLRRLGDNIAIWSGSTDHKISEDKEIRNKNLFLLSNLIEMFYFMFYPFGYKNLFCFGPRQFKMFLQTFLLSFPPKIVQIDLWNIIYRTFPYSDCTQHQSCYCWWHWILALACWGDTGMSQLSHEWWENKN